MKPAYQYLVQQFKNEHISLAEMASIATEYQGLYSHVPSVEVATDLLSKIIKLPQVSENLLVCFALENNELNAPLNTMYQHEDLTNSMLLQIADCYGVIGISNFWEIKLNHPEMIVNLSNNDKVADIALSLIAALSGQLAQMDS
ncbi:hypothetical protein ACQW5G_04560 [Fructilactobacillus sp. Tb1]|uniref:hypothetical protein n=1 Tax=Fructilactobacillus sp. Tb1 TaxID=3422304 RepID=UPI003D2DA24E